MLFYQYFNACGVLLFCVCFYMYHHGYANFTVHHHWKHLSLYMYWMENPLLFATVR